MDMEQIVIKSEIQPNGDILLFYVDESNDVSNTGIVENDQQEDIQMLSETKYVIEDTGESESADELDLAQASEQLATEQWLDEEIRRLIVFYLDNKETFRSGTTKKKHLWAVACKTMLLGKQPLSCEYKLRSFRDKYFQIYSERQKGKNIQWQFYNLCHQAFQDENPVDTYLNVTENKPEVIINPNGNSSNTKKSSADANVERMLKLYLQYKTYYLSNVNQKSVWEKIASDMGEKDVDYWHKRFLNFKQHYVKMLYKRLESGSNSVNWPYMQIFDEIYEKDEEFQKKFAPKLLAVPVETVDKNAWNTTETTFLAKYYFDCFKDFQDPTIPNGFLWHEVGRLLDKKPESCMEKFQELKNAHFDKLILGGYDLASRVPLEIILDNIIAKETEIELDNPRKSFHFADNWQVERLDVLVQYIYDNINMVKDPVCYYVCWATVAKKLACSVVECRKQWDNLTALYKTILDDKKEDPEMQIDWRYIDLFDRIFDYGMDVNLLAGYEKSKNKDQADSGKIGVKKIHIKDIDDNERDIRSDDEVSYDERGFTLRSKRRSGEAKAYKILEYYLKNKDKFSSTNYKKLILWETLAKQIGMTAAECAHRFRNFKQVYRHYIQREINKPEMPIVWPYYALCKKVFGYRAIKAKLKSGKADSSDSEDWSAKEIKKLIIYFANHFSELDNDVENKSKWTNIANEIGRTENSCSEKFIELRKSYRKLKTMKTNNPETKVAWKYFNMMDEIYSNNQKAEVEGMEIDEEQLYANIKSEVPDDDDFQCIIVIPEGGDMSQAQFIYQKKEEDEVIETEEVKMPNPAKVWNKRSKTRLLIQYLKYLKAHENQEINRKDLWTEMANKMDDKSPSACRKMFLLLKNRHKSESSESSPYYKLMQKILAQKPIFKSSKNDDLEEKKIYKDVLLDDSKVEQALTYYLQNLEDFINPKFDKKYLWSELATHLSEPANVVFTKINYLKQSFKNGLETPFRGVLEEILIKENELRENLQDSKNMSSEDNLEETWTDIETERLLTWYLAHLDKFKNPKFVRSYLWMEASDILKKSPLVCSKKMMEVRSQYRTMVKERPEELEEWRFYNLCQRIYGTGKKSVSE
ncbi:uncharacterized protein LOC119837608 [Zerene cesonia]|uniref:uncharacterized protein LOC119837608 n=1 Tax=Zerene cesonia TaxID=33412 RepID=UPI0018E53BF3|nr:uncharacterized protein LOC119837608 [Zerene cesonia]